MSVMEGASRGNYSGSTDGMTGSLSPFGYYMGMNGTRKGA